MKKLQTILMLTAMVFGMTIATAWANTPSEISDWIKLSFDKPVQIDRRTLQPGNYVLEQLPGAQASQDRGTFQIWHNGDKIAVTNPVKYALDKTATQTRATVAVVNGQRYLHRVNVAGSGYGWDFLSPDNAQALRSAQQQNMSEENAIAYTVRPQPNQTAQQASIENSGASGQQGNSGTSAAAGTAMNNQGTTGIDSSSSETNANDNNGASAQQENAAANNQNPDQLVKVIGCVADTNGHSYLLAKDGQQYQLRGDADNVRQYAGKIVTVGGIVNPKTDKFHPMFLTVRELAPTAELCDSGTPQSTNNSGSANTNGANTGSSSSMSSNSSNPESGSMNSANTGNTSTPSTMGSSSGTTSSGTSTGTNNNNPTTGTTPPQR